MEFSLTGIEQGSECSLAGAFPDIAMLQGKLLTIESDDSEVAFPAVRLAMVDTADMVDISKVSWSTRPPSKTVLGTLQASYGANTSSPSFKCPAADRLQIEVACLGRGCRVEYRSDSSQPKLGKFLLSLAEYGSDTKSGIGLVNVG